VAKLLNQFEEHIEAVTVVPSGGGRFEVSVDGELIYSKLKTGRHAESGEIEALLRQKLAE